MAYRLPKTIKKSFVNYTSEAEAELKELSKLKVMASSGSITKQEVQLSIDKPDVLEVRIYDLSNFSVHVYADFNRRIKKLIQ